MKYQEECELLEKSALKNDIFKFKIKTEKIAKEAKAGQFLEIRVSKEVEPFLRRPISIYSIEKDCIEFIFQVKGKGTEILAQKQIGDKINILGPLGNGTFNIKEYNTVAIIGGGIGIFPLYEAVKQLKGKAKINTYLGFRNKEYVTNEQEFKELSDKLIITTDDGSYGEKGFAIDFLKKDEKPDIIMACGPMPMLKAIKKYAEEEKIICQISLEERMGCGLGACLGCAVRKAGSTDDNPDYWHVCKAGPVFYSTNVEI
ncbi:MAG: dihydroorotate dehydrogenase electron transfer subunit [Clostridia bacterium]|nr:dihydroorotate dehydrogenase electron transfer subunit [Clostridia bacterium]